MGPGTASTELFICIGDQPSLDFGGKRNPDNQGFAAFGKVVEGMEVARAIQTLPDEGQYLKEHLLIRDISIIPRR
jgi:peptidyl-prolyl cis-trans isomerase A (cyclophilin A)